MGAQLQAARECEGLDAISVARQAGCSVRRLRRLEAGMEAGLEELGRLARVIGVPMVRLASASLDTAEALVIRNVSAHGGERPAATHLRFG